MAIGNEINMCMPTPPHSRVSASGVLPLRNATVSCEDQRDVCQDQATNLNWRQSNGARVLLGRPTVAHHAAQYGERWFFILSIRDRHCTIAWARRVKSISLDAISLRSISLLSSRLSLGLPRSYLRSQWPRGLSRRSTAARLLGLWVRIPPGAWVFVCCDCFVLSGRGLCDELITRPEESYRLWCVVVCDLENLMNEEPYPINVIEPNIGDTSMDVFSTCH